MQHIVQYHYSLLGYDVRIYVDDRYPFCTVVVMYGCTKDSTYDILYFSLTLATGLTARRYVTK